MGPGFSAGFILDEPARAMDICKVRNEGRLRVLQITGPRHSWAQTYLLIEQAPIGSFSN